jgi:hypothetical protein
MPSKVSALSLATFVALALSLSLTVPGFAQVVGATLSGTVTDASGAVIPNAQLSIKNTATGVTRTTAAGTSGFYTVPNLSPGSYEVTVTAPGFARQVRSGITLTVGAEQSLNMTLQVGQVSQEVQVTGEAPLVELASSTLGATLNSNTAVELPLNGRDWTLLAALQPGVASLNSIQIAAGGPTILRLGHTGYGTQVAVAGTRPELNNYRIDGISAVDALGGSPSSAAGVSLGVDAIGEFSVLTSNYSSQYGRTAGGVVNAITKSGTNAFHGDAYWFLRDEGFDAKTFPDTVIAPFHRNQFGGSLGGPIQKNKTFFFVDYEGHRENRGVTAPNFVPSDDARNGLLLFPGGPSTFPSGCVATGVTNQCKVTVDPKIKPFLGFWPEPNSGVNGNIGTFTFVQNTQIVENYLTAKIDRTISEKDSLRGTFTYDRGSSVQPVPLNLYVFGNSSVRYFVSLEETHVFSPTLVNSVRVGFNRNDPRGGGALGAVNNPLVQDHSLAAFPGLYAPTGGAPGLTGFGGYNGLTNLHHLLNSYQAYDDAFWTKGVHSFKFGFAFERMQNNTHLFLGPNGGYSFGSLAGFLQNQPTRFSGLSPLQRADLGLRQSLFGGYIQDDWRVRKNLTVNLGLRYEMVTVLKESNNRLSNLRNYTDASPQLGSPYYSNPTLKDFAPRVGFAWDPFGSGKTSVRAAFGIFDVLPLSYNFFWGADRAEPFTETISVTNPPQGSFPSGAGGFVPINASASPGSLGTNFIQFKPPRSYMQIWNLSIQRQLTASTSVTIGYVGSHGVHNMDRAEEFNEVRPTTTQYGLLWPCGPDGKGHACAALFLPTGTQANPVSSPVPNPNFGQIVATYWGGDSEYDALTAQVTKRMSHGFQVGGSYSWSKSIDTGSSSTTSDNFVNSVVNLHPYCNKCRRAVSDFDHPQTLAINYVWDVPTPKRGGAVVSRLAGGWELGGIITATSGSPITPLIAGDPLGMKGSAPVDFPSFSGAAGCSSLTNPGNPNYLKLNCFTVPMDPGLGGALCAPFSTVPGSCSNLQGNVGRNTIFGPGIETWDVSVFKNNPFGKISENFNAQFRVEMFNVANRRNLGLPGGGVPSLFDQSGVSNSSTSVITSASTPGRQIQFALKLIW